MNVLDFINSRDVAEHLKSIAYSFSPIEAAYVIAHSQNHTMKERHAALQELIDTTEDCSVEHLSEIPYTDGLHQFLREYMAMELAQAEEFYQSKPGDVYQYSMLCEDDDDWCESDDFFPCFADAFASLAEDRDLSPRFASFVKTEMGRYGYKIYCDVTADGEIVRMSRSEFRNQDRAGEVFYHMIDWEIHLPVPFREGDLVRMVRGAYTHPVRVGSTFVICHGDTELDREYRRYARINNKEVHPYGYFADGDYGIYRELVDDSMISLMNCEYVREELTEADRMLVPLGNYLKGKIDLVSLLMAHKIMTEEHLLRQSRDALLPKIDKEEDMGLSLKS